MNVTRIVLILFGVSSILCGCTGVREVPLRTEVRIPRPALSSSIEIRRAAAVVSKGSTEVRTKTEYVVKKVTEIQLIVTPEVAKELEDVKFQLNENIVQLRDMEAANLELSKQIAFKEVVEIQIRDWGILQENLKDENAKGWILSEQNYSIEKKDHGKTREKLIVEADGNKRKANLVMLLSGGALFFLGLKFVKPLIWQTWLYPVGGAVSGWYLSRYIL